MVEVVSRTPEIPSRAPTPSGPPLRAFAMVLIALGILFAGLGFASLGDSDDEPAPTAAPTTTAAPAAPSPRAAAVPSAPAPAAGNGATSAPAPVGAITSAPVGATTSAAVSSVPSLPAASGTSLAAGTSPAATAPIRVFNNSEVAGLAAQTAAYLEDEGYTISETGNYSEGLLPQTSVFYGSSPGEQQTATAVAESLGVTAQPRFEGIRDAAPGVIVIVTSR